MELKHYFSLILHWGWVLFLGLVLGAGCGILASHYQHPVYQATTKMLVMRAPQTTTSDVTSPNDQELTQTFIQFLTTQSVLDATSAKLGFKIDPKQIYISQLPNTQIIQVSVDDGSPQRSSAIANTLVDISTKKYTDVQDSRYSSTEDSIQAQLNDVESQMTNLQAQISQISASELKIETEQVQTQITPLQNEASILQQDIAKLTPAYTPEQKALVAQKQARLAEIQPLLSLYQQIYSNLIVIGKPISMTSSGNDTMTLVQTTLGLYQQVYTELLQSLESVRLARLENTSNAIQIEQATIPEKPIRPNLLTNTLVATVVGLILAIGTISLIEYLDDTLKNQEEIKRILGLPVIGYIAKMPRPRKGKQELFVTRELHSPITEAFRSLKTNLESFGLEKPLKTLLVTSSDKFAGKTTVAANLAAILAQGGKRILLVDADMRQPNIHRLLNMTNRTGLSNLLSKDVSTEAVIRRWNRMKNMSVITGGPLPSNPVELLSSNKMNQILAKLETFYDMIVIDSPPCMVADAQVLAAKVNGILLVVQPGHTHSESALVAVEQFKRAGTKFVGVVLNRVSRNRGYYYGGYQGYYSNPSGHISAIGKSHPAPKMQTPMSEDKPLG
jgi:succinoglycan biosynthesis transport protein ExoP